jgi:hypothetical protein
VVAVLLIVLAALAVAGTAATGSGLLVTLAAVAAVVLGATATRITHSELVTSREEAARDRAQQARSYADLTEVRTTENVEFAADMTGRIARRDATISRLEKRLTAAAGELAEARQELADARELAVRTQQDAERMASRLASADERATLAIVRVAELEADLDVATRELEAERAAARAWQKGRTA